MKQISFIFQVHQPYRLKEFHFFEIGSHKDYYDDEQNASIMRQVAENNYLPANQLLLDLIKTHGNSIKVSFAISGTALDQMEQYVPEALESFKILAATGNVEFLGQPYSSSLSSLKSKTAFTEEVIAHQKRINALFGIKPTVFLNTGLVYSDEIGAMIAKMGFKGIIIEGLPIILKQRSPNLVYKSASTPALKILLRNQSLSDDIALRFSQRTWNEWPLRADKYLTWLKELPPKDKVVNLVMDYGTFGEHNHKDTGVFEFLEHLLRYLVDDDHLNLSTPEDVLKIPPARAKFKVLQPISETGLENDSSVWLHSELQQEAINNLYKLEENLKGIKNRKIRKDWSYLQSADHFLYMNNENEVVENYFNPYESPYEAFLRYMNVLSDFTLRIANEKKPKKIKKLPNV